MTLLKALLTMSFYGCLMGLVACGVSLIINKVRAPRAVAMVLWALVALRLVCPVEFSSRLSVFNAMPESVQTMAGNPQPSVPDVQTPAANPQVPAADSLPVQPNPQTGQTVQNVPNPLAANVTQDSPAISTPAPESSVSAPAVLITVWAVGAVGLALWGVVSYVLLRRRLQFAMRIDPDVYEVDTITTPCVAGFIPPRVYLPVDLTLEQRLHTIAHERSHIHHGDHIWKLVSYMVLTVHWFNPLVWLCYFRFQQDMEMACDERVLRTLGSQIRADYSQSLLALAKKQRAVVPTPIAFSENATKARITRVLKYKKPLTTVTAILLAAAIILAGCVAAGPVGEPELQMDARLEQLPEELKDSFTVLPSEDKYILTVAHTSDQEMTAAYFYSMTPEEWEADLQIQRSGGYPWPLAKDGETYYVIEENFKLEAAVREDLDSLRQWVTQVLCEEYGMTEVTDAQREEIWNHRQALQAQSQEQLTEPTIPLPSYDPPDPDEIIREAPYDALTIDGLVGIRQQEYFKFPGWSGGSEIELEYFHACPQILLDSEDAQTCNQEMWEVFQRVLESDEEDLSFGQFFTYNDVNYDAWVYEDTLTVYMWVQTSYEYSDHYVYVLDINTGKLLSNAEAAQVAGLNEDTWYSTLHDGIERYYARWAGPTVRDDFYHQQLNATVSQENLDLAVIYPARDGTPMASFRRYNLAGGEYDHDMVNLREIFQPQPLNVQTAVMDIYQPEETMEMILDYTQDDGTQHTGTVTLTGTYNRDRLIVLLSQYNWIQAPVELTYPHNSICVGYSLTFHDVGEGVLSWIQEDGTTTWWVPSDGDEDNYLFEEIRHLYDNKEASLERVSFPADDAQDAAREFVEAIYKRHLLDLTPGSTYAITDYEVVEWSVLATSEDGNAVVLSLEYASVPENWNSAGIWAGNTREGTGEYEGWVLQSRQIGLQRGEDGRWRCYSAGTGGIQLP